MSETSSSPLSDPKFQLMYEHAWNLFDVHAKQRMTLFHFYVVIFLAIITGFSQAWMQNQYRVAILVACLGWFITWLFKKFDDRTKHLLKLSEESLRWAEARFQEVAPDGKWNVIARSDWKKSDPDHKTYGDLFNIMHTLFRIVFLTLGWLGAFELAQQRGLF